MLFTKNQRRVLQTVVASLGLAGSGVFALAQEDLIPSARPVINQDSNIQEPPNTSKGREVLLKARVSDDGTGLVVRGVIDAAETLESLTTLEEVRSMRISESVKTDGTEGGGEGFTGGSGDRGYTGMMGGGMSMEMGMGMGMSMGGMESATPQNARQIAMQKINQLRSNLTSPDYDRAGGEKELRSALSEYFIADLQHRVRELDAVKAKVQEMEARLQKRLDLRQEAVDLQLKRMLHEADGLEFVVPNEPNASAGVGSRISGSLSVPGSLGMPGSLSMPGGSPGMARGYPGDAAGSSGADAVGISAPGVPGTTRTTPTRSKDRR